MEVAACYGINPYQLNAEQLLALHDGIGVVKAQRLIDRACGGEVELSPEQWFDTVLAATGDRRLAEKAHNARAKALLKQESPA